MALVAMLRGVNVGGHRRFRPALLAEQLAHLDAVNIGAAGTFVIRKPVGRDELRDEIARRIPFEAEAMICDGRDILRLVGLDVFAGHAVRAETVQFVSLLSRAPRRSPLLPVELRAGDGDWMVRVLSRHGRFVVGVHRREMRAIRYLGELDALFGAAATTRSWSTIRAIAKVLDG